MSNNIAIIDYGMGNLRSVQKALDKINVDSIITNEHNTIKNSDKIILPGVGAFKDAMRNLQELNLVDLLNEEVLQKKKPFLGICLGMQLLGTVSEEFGETQGLGWIDAKIVKFSKSSLKIPHVGWNNVYHKDLPLFKNIPHETDFYFVHSYYLFDSDKKHSIGTCDYGINFTCAVEKENIFAVQFHPEKSQTYGLTLLKNFTNLENDF